MEALQDRLIPIAVLLIVIASQLFWLRRLVDLGERFIPGKRGRARLKAVVVATCLFFFAANLVPWESFSRNPTSASTTLTLRSVLLGAPFSWWLVGSLAGFGLVIVFRTLDRAVRGAAWAYRKARAAVTPQAAAPEADSIAHDLASPARRRFLEQTAVAVCATPFVAAGYGLLYGRLDIEVSHRRIRLVRLPKAFEGFRIVQLSDIHISPFLTGDQVRRCVTIANGLKGDLVVLTGDFLSYDPSAQGEVVHILADLRAPYGVFGCLGNHEYMTKIEESITRLFAAEQIRILRQERVAIQSDVETLNLIGVDYQQARFSRDHDGHLVNQYLEGSEKLVMPGTVNILLSHNPNAFDRSAALGIDLMLAGHTHGGQFSLEFLHRGLSLARIESPFVSGWFEKTGSQLYVNRGIGTTGPPIRFGSPPEITVLELVRGT
jgi:predicted MPP superfamily phosphohydrolase